MGIHPSFFGWGKLDRTPLLKQRNRTFRLAILDDESGVFMTWISFARGSNGYFGVTVSGQRVPLARSLGSIPREFGQLEALEDARFHLNNLTGELCRGRERVSCSILWQARIQLWTDRACVFLPFWASVSTFRYVSTHQPGSQRRRNAISSKEVRA